MSSISKKIPEMFLKSYKRKSEVLLEATSTEARPVKRLAEKPVAEPKPEEKENMKKTDSLALFDLLTNDSWKSLLQPEFEKSYMKKIESFLLREYSKGTKIFPPRAEIFSAFNISSLEDVRVVIIGQDPYHDDNQAHGMSFSVKTGVKPPPSLKNIYKELCQDFSDFTIPNHGYLLGWARQGVFMLNATLTVEAHKANSHSKIGWQQFTDHVIKLISRETEGVVFLLWGGFAHKKETLIDAKKHAIIKTAHPSPLSARHWFGNRCFSKTNTALKQFNKPPIDWNDLKESY